ncbi:MAG: helix-turn-helix transcriptional regulator [Candidatus Marsarchaeota archaeon]|nr:helix-turn-helix transcriptional regulator [Candidatus Marsarchaeota archaeon]MCL5102109.1 helix-turn-helix transcriptional regulator [Candidatus Marsarchaeota archaeon]
MEVEHCGAQEILSIVSKKWLLLVLNSINTYGPSRYNELLKRLVPISPKALADTLKVLVENDFVAKGKLKGAIVYSMTEAGFSLAKASLPLLKWSRPFCSDKSCEVAIEMDKQLSRS